MSKVANFFEVETPKFVDFNGTFFLGENNKKYCDNYKKEKCQANLFCHFCLRVTFLHYVKNDESFGNKSRFLM